MHALSLAFFALSAHAADSTKLHLPAPDWRDQVIYFAMIDRFDDGDPSNDDQHAGEFDPHDGAKYSGGDLRGLERRLRYIQTLGATALWITPPVANQWWDERSRYGGYHGYWASSFVDVDAHFGTLADYQSLSRALHGAGMYLIQDIVVNHVGNFFAYSGDEFEKYGAPTQPPFDRNDARDPAQRADAIYHWTPDIVDYADPNQQLNFQLAGLDDLDTENGVVRRALRASYGRWIDAVGVDAFRIDTAFYVPREYFRDFLYADDATAPGMIRKRKGFYAFGEGFGIDAPFSDAQARRIEGYVRADDGKPLIPGMLNFPLYGSVGSVFARGRPTAELGYRIRNLMTTHSRPHLMPSFVDNHDVDRFLAGGSEAALREALLAILTLPGVPVIYYGTEQGFTGQRAAMFAGGFGSGGCDHFDTGVLLYGFLQRAIALRREHRVFSRGVPTVLRENASGPGVLAYRMRAREGDAIVAFNTGAGAALLDNLETGLAAGTRLRGAFASDDGKAADLVAGAGGRVSAILPPRAGLVWLADGRARDVPAQKNGVTLDPLVDLSAVSGAAPAGRVRLVVDGDLDRAVEAQVDARGRYSATIDTSAIADAEHEHRLVAVAGGEVSAPRTFRVANAWKEAARIEDPANDERYAYPTAPGWASHTLDLREVVASTTPAALRIDVKLADVTAQWSPPNGFDHLALTVFVEAPGVAGGARVMPQQRGELPAGMRWNFRFRVGGWASAAFSARGASADSEGEALARAPDVRVDRDRGVISLVIARAALPGVAAWSGMKVIVNTWDHDGGYRPLRAKAEPNAFGGGAEGDPLVMDESGVLVLP